MPHILALQAFHGGSHRAVLEGWQHNSSHRFTTLTLPPRHWKWRMRHAAWTFAQEAKQLTEVIDLVWCTDMLDLAAWRGLAPPHLRTVPCVYYFHENQLTYPDARRTDADLHFACTNLLSAAAADAVWWNSAWHRQDCLAAARDYLQRLPDHQPLDLLDHIDQRSQIIHPGFSLALPSSIKKHTDEPCHLLWAARWEADKGSESMFAVFDALLKDELPFTCSIIGGHEHQPGPFAALRERLGTRVRNWGYQDDRTAYESCLQQADCFFSTADHEFFGLSAIEAAAAGCKVLLPDKLAYPEVFSAVNDWPCLYPPSPTAAASCIKEVLQHKTWFQPAPSLQSCAQQFRWTHQVGAWDQAVEQALG